MQAATAEAQVAKQHIGTLEAQIERLMTSKADLSDVVSTASLQQAMREVHAAVDNAVTVRVSLSAQSVCDVRRKCVVISLQRLVIRDYMRR